MEEPIVKGGQGRSGQETRTSATTIFVLIVTAAVAGVVLWIGGML